MQGGGGGRHGLFDFGDPLAGFGGFGPPRNLMSSLFGGANPFDDPFFTNPFGSMMQPGLVGPSIFGGQSYLSGGMSNAGMFGGPQAMFGPIMFGGPQAMFRGGQADLSQGMRNADGFVHQAPEPSRPKGPIITELNSDDDEEDVEDDNTEDDKKTAHFRKHPRTSKAPHVEDPDEEAGDNKRPKHGEFGRHFNRASTSHHPQAQTFMFQSSSVTYGGPNGACYTSSTSRRTGGDGITLEEHKEADTTTGKATHRISRGIGNKGHMLTRKLNTDGHVNTLQTLHNLNEDELSGFDESWRRNAGGNFCWDSRMNLLGRGSIHPAIRNVNQMPALTAPVDQSQGSSSSRNMQKSSSMGHSHRT